MPEILKEYERREEKEEEENKERFVNFIESARIKTIRNKNTKLLKMFIDVFNDKHNSTMNEIKKIEDVDAEELDESAQEDLQSRIHKLLEEEEIITKLYNKLVDANKSIVELYPSEKYVNWLNTNSTVTNFYINNHLYALIETENQIKKLKDSNQNNITTKIIDDLITEETDKAIIHYETNKDVILSNLNKLKDEYDKIKYNKLNDTYNTNRDNILARKLEMNAKDVNINKSVEKYLSDARLDKSKPGEMAGYYKEEALTLTAKELPELRTLRKGGKRRRQKTKRRQNNKKSHRKRR